MLTGDGWLNIFLVAWSVTWLVCLPLTLQRMIQKRNKRKALELACSAVTAILLLLSVALPFQRQGTLNTPNDFRLFGLGIVINWLPDLIAWWRRHRARAA